MCFVFIGDGGGGGGGGVEVSTILEVWRFFISLGESDSPTKKPGLFLPFIFLIFLTSK